MGDGSIDLGVATSALLVSWTAKAMLDTLNIVLIARKPCARRHLVRL